MKRFRIRPGTAIALLSLSGMALAEDSSNTEETTKVETEVISWPEITQPTPAAEDPTSEARTSGDGEKRSRTGERGQRDGNQSGTRDGSRRANRSS